MNASDTMYIVDFTCDGQDTTWVFDDIAAAMQAINDAPDSYTDFEIQVFFRDPDNPHMFTFSHTVAITETCTDTDRSTTESESETESEGDISVVSSGYE